MGHRGENETLGNAVHAQLLFRVLRRLATAKVIAIRPAIVAGKLDMYSVFPHVLFYRVWLGIASFVAFFKLSDSNGIKYDSVSSIQICLRGFYDNLKK